MTVIRRTKQPVRYRGKTQKDETFRKNQILDEEFWMVDCLSRRDAEALRLFLDFHSDFLRIPLSQREILFFLVNRPQESRPKLSMNIGRRFEHFCANSTLSHSDSILRASASSRESTSASNSSPEICGNLVNLRLNFFSFFLRAPLWQFHSLSF